MVIESNSFVGLGSGAVQFDYMDTEGLCARSAVVRNNVVTDVSQLASHGTSPACAPRAAFWTDGPYSMAEERLWENDAQRFNGVHQPQRKQPAPVGGLPLHQDLLYANRVSPVIPLHIYIYLNIFFMLISICIIFPGPLTLISFKDTKIIRSIRGRTLAFNSTVRTTCLWKATT